MHLLSGTTRVQELQLRDLVGLSSSTAIVGASIADPYLLLQLSSGNAILLQAAQDEGAFPYHTRSNDSHQRHIR